LVDSDHEMNETLAAPLRQKQRDKGTVRNRKPGRSVVCKLCGIRIKRSDNLLIHYRGVHKLNPPKGAHARTWDPREPTSDLPPQVETETAATVTSAIEQESEVEDSDAYGTSVNAKKLYDCQLCTKQTTRSFDLKRHYRKVHDLYPPSGRAWHKNWDASKAMRGQPQVDTKTSDPVIEKFCPIPEFDADYDSGYDKGGYSCKLCVRQVPRIEDLRIHYQDAHSITPPKRRGWVQDWNPTASGQDSTAANEKVSTPATKNHLMGNTPNSIKDKTSTHQNPRGPIPAHAKVSMPVIVAEKPQRSTKDGTFVCRLCNKGLTRMFHLRSHYQKIHGVTMPRGEEVD
jgi:hypothetical protein